MNALLDFLIRHKSRFIFVLYFTISLALLFNNNPYQQSVMLSSANSLSATVYEGYSSVSSYFGLRSVNEELQARNAALEMDVVSLKQQLDEVRMHLPDSTGIMPMVNQFEYVTARVINNSVTQPANYITIDRGSADGISPEMGVVDHNGVVGVVNVVGKHSARVISLLNPNLKISCMVRRNGFFGSLVWEGRDPAYATLKDLPRQGKFQKGDTVVTSGYSTMFPRDIMVGVVESAKNTGNGNFAELKVRLSTNFTRLTTVRALKNNSKDELKALELMDADENGNKIVKEEKKDDKRKK